MSYKKYGTKDFILDESFQQWVLFNTEDDKRKWELYAEKNPDKHYSITLARQILKSVIQKVLLVTESNLDDFSKEQKIAFEKMLEDDMKTFIDFSETEIDIEIRRLNLALNLSKNDRKAVVIPFYKATWFKVAASLLLIVGLGTQLYFSMPSSPDTIQSLVKNDLMEIANNTEKPMLLTLSDGSSIILQVHSSLSFLQQFGTDKREINLSGEAFFEIAKDKSRPFFIYTDRLTTKVTGTSFTIRAYENDKEVQVIVKTGKVTVFADKGDGHLADAEADSVDLLPDQQASFGENEPKIAVSAIVKAALKEFSIQQQLFEFDETPIFDVFYEMEKAYGIKIVSKEPTINNKKLTAFLNDKPYEKKLELICKLVNASYEQKDNVVIITPNTF